MEAVPRMPMLFFDLKSPTDCSDFKVLKEYIQHAYHENPENYALELHSLEALRSKAVHPQHNVDGVSILKKYYCQLTFLKSRFPITREGPIRLTFTWKEAFSSNVVSSHDVRFEQLCIMFNIGSLHSKLGVMDERVTSEGLKLACSHFQCAAWAFQQLKEMNCPDIQMSSSVISFMVNTCLAQAQECVLEQSLTGNRKPIINAKVAAQIVDFYSVALNALSAISPEQLKYETNCCEVFDVKTHEGWKKYLRCKIHYYKAITLLYQGMQAEEEQKMGERVTYYDAAFEKLTESMNGSKAITKSEITRNLHDLAMMSEAFSFTMDVIEGKRKAARADNEFVYHEKVPALDTLPELKGRDLVKCIPFSPNDRDISGPDIFEKLIPMKAHEAASLYSEEKAKLLRHMGSKVENQDAELAKFMNSLQLDIIGVCHNPERLPQDLIDKCAEMTARPNAIQELTDAMAQLSDSYHDVDAMLEEMKALVAEEEESEKEYQEIMGPRPPSIVATDLKREMNKYLEAHKKAQESNETLHQVMKFHIANLKLLSLTPSQLEQHIPPLTEIKTAETEKTVGVLEHLVSKVEEMRQQRQTLLHQLRQDLLNDEITSQLVTRPSDCLETVFESALAKHNIVTNLIEKNLQAQPRILSALTDAYTACAPTRTSLAEVVHRRNSVLAALRASYDAYEDLRTKTKRGVEFYEKLANNVKKLQTRVKGTCNVQEEERLELLKKENKILPRHKKKAAAAQVVGPSEDSSNLAPQSIGPKLKDYLAAGGSYSRGHTSGYRSSVYPSDYPYPSVPTGVRPTPVGSEMNIEVMSDSTMSYSPYDPTSSGKTNGTTPVVSTQNGMSYHSSAPYHAAGSNPGPGQIPSSTYSVPQYSDSYNIPNSNYPTNPNTYSGGNTQSHPDTTSQKTIPDSKASPSLPQSQYQNTQASVLSNQYSATSESYPAYTTPYTVSYSNFYTTPDTQSSPVQYSRDSAPSNSTPQTSQVLVNAYSATPLSTQHVTPSQYYPYTSTTPVTSPTYVNTSHIPNVSYTSTVSPAPQHLYQYSSGEGYSSQSGPGYQEYPSPSPSPYNPSNAYASTQYSQYSSGQTCDQIAPAQYVNTLSTLPSQYGNSASIPQSQYGNSARMQQSQYGNAASMPQSQYENSASMQQSQYGNAASMPQSQYGNSANNPQSLYGNTVHNPQSQYGNTANIPQSQYGNTASIPQSQDVNSVNNPQSQYGNSASTLQSQYGSPYATLPSQYANTPPSAYENPATSTSTAYPNIPNTQPTYGQSYNQTHPTQDSAGSQTSSGSTLPQTSYAATSLPSQQTPNQSIPVSQPYGYLNYATEADPHDSRVSFSPYTPEQIYPGESPSYSYNSSYSNAGHPNYLQTQSSAYTPQETPQGVHNYYSVPYGTQSYIQANGNSYVNTTASTLTSPDAATPHASLYNMGSPQYTSSQSNVDLLADLDVNITQSPLIPCSDTVSTSSDVTAQLSNLSLSHATSTCSSSDVIRQTSTDWIGSSEQTPLVEKKILEELPSVISNSGFVAPKPAAPSTDITLDKEALTLLAQDVEKLEKVVESLTTKSLGGPTPLDTKWKELSDLQTKDSAHQCISVARCYPMKNRSPDILPYDSSRVELPSTKDDYINASYIQSPVVLNAPPLIVTQAPLSSTVADFWTMVWEKSVELVVCLLTDAELDLPVYWPSEKGQDLDLPKFRISLQSRNLRGAWTERILSMQDQDRKLTRVVVHLQLTAWPGSSFPSSPAQFVSLLTETLTLYKQQRSLSHNIVVHCSTGIGRSGLFSLVLLALGDINIGKGVPDLVQLAASISASRKNLLRDREHFKYAYQCVLYYSQDLLIRRGVLSRSSFEDIKPKTHTRLPSQDFLHSAVDYTSLEDSISSKKGHSRKSSSSSICSSSNKAEIFSSQVGTLDKLSALSTPHDPLSQIDPLWPIKKEKDPNQ